MHTPHPSPARLWQRPQTLAAGLFAVSLLLRALFALEMRDSPLFRHHEWRETDNHFFVDWAQQIAEGDVLGRMPLHPYHAWHAEIARHWARGQGFPYDVAAGQALWNTWYGGLRFHQEPLYAYMLALTRWLTGDVRWIFALQALAGALTTVLIFGIGRRIKGTAAGVVGAAAHLAYGPMLYYDFMLHRTSLQTFGGVLAVWCIMRAHESGSRRDAAVLGAVLGLLALLSASAGPLLLAVAVVLYAIHRSDALPRIATMCAAAALVVSPAVARNVMLGVPPLQMSSVAAITFVDANASDVDPSAGFTQSQHATDIMTETHGDFAAAAIAAVVTHVGAGWLELLAQKLVYFFAPLEIPNNDSYAYYASYSSLLGGPLLGFGLFASLFCMGLGAGIVHRRVAWPALLQIGAGLALVLLFYNLSRFRAPVVAAAMPLMALAIVDFVAAARARRLTRMTALLALAAAPWVALALVKPVSALPIRAVDITEGNLRWQSIIADEPDKTRALAIAERALALGPNIEVLVGARSPWRRGERARVARSIASLERQAAALGSAPAAATARHEKRAAELEALATSLETNRPSP